jgi:hypothetical protein
VAAAEPSTGSRVWLLSGAGVVTWLSGGASVVLSGSSVLSGVVSSICPPCPHGRPIPGGGTGVRPAHSQWGCGSASEALPREVDRPMVGCGILPSVNRKKIVAIGSPVLAVAAGLVLVTDLAPGARGFAQNEWWLGWVLVVILGGVVGFMINAVDDFQFAKGVKSRISELEDEKRRLEERIEAFANRPVQAVRTGKPSLRLKDQHQGVYPLYNWNEGYTISKIVVHSLTPGVSVEPLERDYLNPPDVEVDYRGDDEEQEIMTADVLMVAPSFPNNEPMPWEYCITYSVAENFEDRGTALGQ